MPHGPFQTPISIDPWHFALALCDWIGYRSTTLEAPDVLGDSSFESHPDEFLANDFRNHRLPAALDGRSQSELPVYAVSNDLNVLPRGEVGLCVSAGGDAFPLGASESILRALTLPARHVSDNLPKETCHVRVL